MTPPSPAKLAGRLWHSRLLMVGCAAGKQVVRSFRNALHDRMTSKAAPLKGRPFGVYAPTIGSHASPCMLLPGQVAGRAGEARGESGEGGKRFGNRLTLIRVSPHSLAPHARATVRRAGAGCWAAGHHQTARADRTVWLAALEAVRRLRDPHHEATIQDGRRGRPA